MQKDVNYYLKLGCDKKIAKYATQAIEYSKTSSETEKNATLIERDFDDLYKYEKELYANGEKRGRGRPRKNVNY